MTQNSDHISNKDQDPGILIGKREEPVKVGDIFPYDYMNVDSPLNQFLQDRLTFSKYIHLAEAIGTSKERLAQIIRFPKLADFQEACAIADFARMNKDACMITFFEQHYFSQVS